VEEALASVAERTDGQLLAEFMARRDAAAFEALVRRHGPMVLRVCQRVLHDPHDAEDAFQATFIVLLRKARAIAKSESLGSWLHGVAYRIALKAKASASRRHAHEKAVDEQALPTRPAGKPPAEATWQEVRQVLDEELSRLPEKYRGPLVLCYLEGKTNDQAAEQLGWSRGMVAGQLSRGRDLLRHRLARRGLVLTSLALGAVLTQNAAAAAVPPALIQATVQGTALLAAGQAVSGSLLSTSAGSFADSAISAMFWAKAKVCAMAVVAATAVAVTAPVLLPAGQPPPAVVPSNPVQLGVNASLGGRRLFPDDNAWNQDIAQAPIDPASQSLIAAIGADKPLYADFGPSLDGGPWGIPYVVVPGSQPKFAVRFENAEESDPGPYPIPPAAPVEKDRQSARLLILDRDNWKLYELNFPARDGNGWRAGGGAVFDLNSNQQRPRGWASADTAGMAVLPGLVRYDEVKEQQAIRHALRFTCKRTRRAFVEPARHFSSDLTDPNLPPMGMRVRLKAGFDVSGFPRDAQVILTALKHHGMFLVGNGSDWYLSGTADPRWHSPDLKTLGRVKGRDFEVVRMGKVKTSK
jgi:RNA polymerase sigma factor (sigma-70 family)